MASELVVKTNYGPVQGCHREGLNGIKYVSFKGIPYAKPPVGELRFKSPQKPEPWTDTFDASDDGPSCPAQIIENQPDFPDMNLRAGEDCLVLNVFKNNADFSSKVPVMVYIHGGGFVMGSSAEVWNSPELLMRDDVIMVSINYRIGLLGFLSIADPAYEIPGNAGLKDQTLALRWVLENISHFGGDPENVTIFGVSAGGASVHYHLISEYSKGLFHKAIVQSGSALNVWAYRKAGDDLNERLAKNLGWNGEGGNKAMWDLIVNTDTDVLIKKQPSSTDLEKQIGLLFNFVPVVEPYDNGDCFISKPLVELNCSAWGNEIPLIVGGTSDEGYLFFNEYEKNKDLFTDNSWFNNSLPKELNLPLDSDERKSIGEKMKHHYYGDKEPSVDDLDDFARMLNEKYFWHGINSIVKRRVADANSAPTYLYRFNYTSPLLPLLHFWMAGRILENKSLHGEDSVYLLNPFNSLKALKSDSLEWKVVDNLVSLWTSFAFNGKPISDATKNNPWTPVESSTIPYKCLNINQESKMIDLPNTNSLMFWDALYDL